MKYCYEDTDMPGFETAATPSVHLRSRLLPALAWLAISFGLPTQDVGAVPPVPAPKPNVIVILADDLGFGDLSIFGSGTIQTPNIDQIASEGVRFTDFYAAPECGPIAHS